MEEIKNINALLTNASNVSFQSPTSISNLISKPFVKTAASDNTCKAYRSDIKHKEKWWGTLTIPETIIYYLQTFASTLNSRTSARRLIAFKHWHIYQGLHDSTSHPIVAKTTIGLTHVYEKPKEKAPLLANLANAEEITPHSLHRGLGTSASRINACIKTIIGSKRWKNVNTILEYIGVSEHFKDSAATSVLYSMK